MGKFSPEIWAGIVCFVAAAGFGVLAAHWQNEADASHLVAVDAAFSVSRVRHGVNLTNKDGTTSIGDERLVDAVFQFDGKSYRHSVPESMASRVVAKLPGHGSILIDPTDPSKSPRIASSSRAAAPLLACILSALLAAVFFFNAWRHTHRKDEA